MTYYSTNETFLLPLDVYVPDSFDAYVPRLVPFQFFSKMCTVGDLFST